MAINNIPNARGEAVTKFNAWLTKLREQGRDDVADLLKQWFDIDSKNWLQETLAIDYANIVYEAVELQKKWSLVLENFRKEAVLVFESKMNE